MAVVQQRRGEIDAAMASLNQAIGLDPKNFGLYRSRAFLYLEIGDVQDAASDFSRSLEPNPRDRYVQLWLDVARRRSAQPSQLAEAAKGLNLSAWPGPIIKFYLGEITFSELMSKADDADPSKLNGQMCTANYFAGELALAEKDSGKAAKLLGDAVNICPESFAASTVARAELRSLGMNP
ncbi:tetratricopeptide repeat protein [Bradyrhizobium sp.]